MVEPLTTAQALNRALRDEMRSSKRVVVLGEDVGRLGGIFRVTDGLQKRFGQRRVFDTPASEAGIAGVALGLALAGFRPVAEMQFAAYSYPAFEQITSHIARYRLRTMSRVSLPLVIRMPVGGGLRGKEHHAENPETYFVHTPGLKVVTPSGPMEAYDLLTQAIRDPDPVVFLEPQVLYGKSEVGTPGAGDIPMHQAKLVHDGTDLTIVSYGAMVRTCLEAAERLATQGILAQVLDLRSLAPLDTDSIRDCVRFTGRAVVVHEAPMTLGVSAEVSARIMTECFEQLRAPVLRVTAWDTPNPPPSLEDLWRPSVERIVGAARQTFSYARPPG